MFIASWVIVPQIPFIMDESASALVAMSGTAVGKIGRERVKASS